MTFIEEDEWLGKILGKPAYRVGGRPSDLLAETLPQMASLVEARLDVEDFQALAHLQGLGFEVIDCNVTLELPVAGAPLGRNPVALSPEIRFATAEDEVGVRALARNSFEHNRFKRDPRIPNEIADEIKEEWASNFFAGLRGDWMVVAEEEGEIIGFLQLLRLEGGKLLIDLIAVASHMQRQGIARLMCRFAFRNCMKRPARILVGTQLSNRVALRLYESMGFTTSNVVYVLHLHKEDN